MMIHPHARPAARLLDRDQFVAAGAAVRLAGAGAVAGDLDADTTAAALVAAGQLGSSLMGRHEYHLHSDRGTAVPSG